MALDMLPKRSAKREPVNVTGNVGGDGPSKVPPTLRAVVTGGVHVAVLLAGPVCCVDMVAGHGSMRRSRRHHTHHYPVSVGLLFLVLLRLRSIQIDSIPTYQPPLQNHSPELNGRGTSPRARSSTGRLPGRSVRRAPPDRGEILFDGKSLDGWQDTPFIAKGKVTIEDGKIILGSGAIAKSGIAALLVGLVVLELRRRKLKILYLGLESGDDATLRAIDKGATSSEIVTAVRRAQAERHLPPAAGRIQHATSRRAHATCLASIQSHP